MHLDLDDSIAAAGFAATAFHIKTEAPLLISLRLGICSCCEQITDLVKNTGISCRIGTGCSSDRRLINIDHLVQLINPENIIMFTRNYPGTVQIPCQSLIKDLIDQ